MPQNTIKDFHFDNAGYLWIATENGLVRFDGTVFKSSAVLQTNSIGRIAAMNKNADNRIFVTDINGAVVELNDGKLISIKIKAQNKQSTANITLGTRLPFNLFQKLNKLNFINTKDDNNLYDLIPMMGLRYYLIYKYKIALYEDTTLLFENPFPSKEGYRLFKINNKLFAHNIKKGFYQIDESSKKWIKFTDDFGFNKKVSMQIIWKNDLPCPFIIYERRLYKICCTGNKIKTTLLIDSLALHSLVTCAAYNKNWEMYLFGTETDGLYFYKENLFKTMRSNNHNKPYYGQYELSTGDVLTNKGDIVGFKKNKTTPFIKSFNNYIINASDGNIYYSSGDTVYRYRKDLKRVERIFINRRSQMFALEYQKDTLWMINANGIFFHTQDKNFTSLLFNADQRNLPYIIERITPGMFLYGNCLGLFSYVPGIKKVDTLLWIPQKCVRSLYKFHDYLYIGTYGDGWKIWNGKTIINMPLDRKEFLKEAHCFIKDKNNFLWIPTNHGLFTYYIPDIEKFVTGQITSIYYNYYGKADGIENAEFNGGCYPCALQLSNGYTSIPNLGGLVWFKPEEIKHNTILSPIIIDKFEVDNKAIDIDKKPIHLDAHTNIVRVTLSSPFFGNEQNAPLQYRTYGVDTTWKFLDRNNMIIRYTTLPSGDYRIELRSPQGFAKPYLVWKLEFTVLRPWYLSIPAIATEILLFVSLLALFIRLRVQHYKKRELELKQQVDQKVNELKLAYNKLEQNIQILEEYQQELLKSNANKSRLIKILSHDIIGPLRFMAMVCSQVEKHKTQIDKKQILEYMVEIHTTSENLLALCNDLISWASYQKESMKVSYTHFDLNKIIEEKLGFFQQIAATKSINLQNNCPASFYIKNDKNIVKIVLHNLLSNAIKFTESGSITVFAGRTKDHYYVSVMDSGVGMSEEQVYDLLHNNFSHPIIDMERNTGYGIGYLIINDLLKATKGTISIKSSKGKGTKVNIKWPEMK